jgi:hypothetical protein
MSCSADYAGSHRLRASARGLPPAIYFEQSTGCNAAESLRSAVRLATGSEQPMPAIRASVRSRKSGDQLSVRRPSMLDTDNCRLRPGH